MLRALRILFSLCIGLVLVLLLGVVRLFTRGAEVHDLEIGVGKS